MKTFHYYFRKTLKKGYLPLLYSLLFFTFSACATEKVYDAQNSFKPAQRSLAEIMLQLAESLEHHKSPEPYIRHVLAEDERIHKKYARAVGKKNSIRPDYLSDEYVENLLRNWNKLEKPLQLNQLSEQSGKYMRYAIMGDWNKQVEELVADETKLSGQELVEYERFLRMPFFKKGELPELDRFYQDGGAWDKLSEAGRDQISLRLNLAMAEPEKRDAWLKQKRQGTMLVILLNEFQGLLLKDLNDGGENEVNSDRLEEMLSKRLRLNQTAIDLSKLSRLDRDAIKYSHLMKQAFEQRFEMVRNKVPAEKAKFINGATFSMAENLLVLAILEIRLGMREEYVNHLSSRH